MLLPEATLMSVIPAALEALDPVLGSTATRSPVCDFTKARIHMEVHNPCSCDAQGENKLFTR